MKRVLTSISIIIFLFSFVNSACEDGQVDINSASIDELDSLTGIGEAKAQAIIDTRPFESIDDLIKVKGIGEATLNKIKAQGLACVSAEKQSIKEIKETEDDIQEEENQNVEIIEETEEKNQETISSSIGETKTENIINLNQGSEIVVDNKVVYESRTEIVRKYAIYIFSGFLIVIIFILLLRNND